MTNRLAVHSIGYGVYWQNTETINDILSEEASNEFKKTMMKMQNCLKTL